MSLITTPIDPWAGFTASFVPPHAMPLVPALAPTLRAVGTKELGTACFLCCEEDYNPDDIQAHLHDVHELTVDEANKLLLQALVAKKQRYVETKAWHTQLMQDKHE